MDKERLMEHRRWIRQQLNASAEFWLRHGMDPEHGGVYTCLDRSGRVYSTDKSVWMQGRCGWVYAYLCNTYGEREEWKAASKSCIDFLEAHCINRDAGNRMYFTVTAEGKPLRQRRYCFSEEFYTIANAEYYMLTGEKEHLQRARQAYELVHGLYSSTAADPTGQGPKTIPETRTWHGLGGPMIYLKDSQIMRQADPERAELYTQRARECVAQILNLHYKPELGATLENVAPDGAVRLEITDGRIVNPGHDIECAWFLLEEALYTKDAQLRETAIHIFDMAISRGWDGEYGGLLYFFDCLGNPPEAYEHDMKLWWPHNEILIASLMIYRETGDGRYLDWFEKTLAYCQKYFADPQYGEWYGYLRRDGKPTEPAAKGSTFKGPFHLPRCMVMCDGMLTELIGD